MTPRRVIASSLLFAAIVLGIGLIANALFFKTTGEHQVGPPKIGVAQPANAGSRLPPSVGIGAERDSSERALAPAPARSALPGQAAMTAPLRSELSVTERSPLADRLGLSTTIPAQEPGIVLEVLNAYRRTFGVYPAGEDNRQIMNALLGANAQKLPFVPADHPRLNENGELVDAWATPFFFHLLSRDSIEVRSAGPDRAMYTADDIVAGRQSSKRTDSEYR